MFVDASTYNYCENLSGFIITQPINVFSNLIFWIAAYWFWQHKDKFDISNFHVATLSILAFLVGLNSSIWHITSTQWGLLLDISTIGVFATTSMYIVFKYRLNWSLPLRLISILAIVGSAIWFKEFMPHVFTLNSGAFIPLSLALLFLGAYMKEWSVILAGLSLASGLFFRIIDLSACNFIPFGAHFLWHVLAGIALWLFVNTLYRKTSTV